LACSSPPLRSSSYRRSSAYSPSPLACSFQCLRLISASYPALLSAFLSGYHELVLRHPGFPFPVLVDALKCVLAAHTRAMPHNHVTHVYHAMSVCHVNLSLTCHAISVCRAHLRLTCSMSLSPSCNLFFGHVFPPTLIGPDTQTSWHPIPFAGCCREVLVCSTTPCHTVNW